MKFFTQDEVQKLINVSKPRYALLFEFLISTGARVSEALMLEQRDFEQSYVKLKTLKQKNNRPTRIIPLNKNLVFRILGFAKSKNKIWSMSRSAVIKQIYRAKKKAGFNERDNKASHAFRHGFAKICLDQCVDLRDLQRYLGHSSISMTSNYLTITKEYLTRLHSVNFLPARQLTLLNFKKGERT